MVGIQNRGRAMAAITFDTFKFVERLEKAGVPREQAAAFVEAQQQSLSEALDNSLATKADVREVKTEVRELKAELKADMEKMELRMTIKLGALIAAAVGILIAVLRVSH
ncbi:conserved hypothetical protein [Gammaproteobacteria bacterium]